MKQIKELGLIETQTFHIVGPFLPAADTLEMREIYKENNAISSWYGISEIPNNEKQAEFIAKYKARFGIEPRPDAAFFYDDVHFLAKVLENCDPYNKECISDGLLTGKYEGVSGVIEFDSNGISKRRVPIINFIDGHWVEV
jgi:ABC-type branched-subunit amino acid transport system substrate-binding protein